MLWQHICPTVQWGARGESSKHTTSMLNTIRGSKHTAFDTNHSGPLQQTTTPSPPRRAAEAKPLVVLPPLRLALPRRRSVLLDHGLLPPLLRRLPLHPLLAQALQEVGLGLRLGLLLAGPAAACRPCVEREAGVGECGTEAVTEL